MSKGKTKSGSATPKYLYEDVTDGKFLMLPPELFESETFNSIKPKSAQLLYILMATHKETDAQRKLLYSKLKEYNEWLDLGMSKETIIAEAFPNKRTKAHSNGLHNYFVFPENHFKKYGWSASGVYKAKNVLIEKGFIEIAFGGKSKIGAFDENVTIYNFVDKWKKE